MEILRFDNVIDIFSHIFTAHAQKQPFLSLRLQFSQHHWIQQPRFPLSSGNFGNQKAFTAVFGCCSLRTLRIGIICASGPKSVIIIVLRTSISDKGVENFTI